METWTLEAQAHGVAARNNNERKRKKMKMVMSTRYGWLSFAVVWGPSHHVAKAIEVVGQTQADVESFAMDVHEARSNGKPRWLRHVVSYKRFATNRFTKGLTAFALFEDREPAEAYAKRLNDAVAYASELMFGTKDPDMVCPVTLNPYRTGGVNLGHLSEKGYKSYVRGLWDREPMGFDELVKEWEFAGYEPEDPKDRWDTEA